MDTKEEMIEEIDEMEDLSTDSKESAETKAEEIKPDVPVVEPAIEEDILPGESNNDVAVVENKELNAEANDDETNNPDVLEEKQENTNTEYELPKKSKAPIIVLLSILLVLDIAALVIYMIGIEKVISFIK